MKHFHSMTLSPSMLILFLVYIITHCIALQNCIPLQLLFQIRWYLYHHLPFLLADDAFVSQHVGPGYLVSEGMILIPTAHQIAQAPTPFSVMVSLTWYHIFSFLCIRFGSFFLLITINLRLQDPFNSTITTENAHNAFSVHICFRTSCLFHIG